MTRTENRSTRRFVYAGIAAALVALLAAGAFAFGPRHGRGMFHERMLEHVLDEADASDEQRAQIIEIMDAARADVEALRPGGRGEHREAMLEVWTAETVDRTQVDALRAEHQAQMEAVMDRMTDAVVDAAAVLTQEQRVAIADAMRERFERHGRHGRWGRGHHRGEGQDDDERL